MYRLSYIRTSEEITLIFIIAALSVLLIFSIMFVISPDFFNKISILEPIQLLVLKISEFFGYVAINYYQLIRIYLPLGVIGFLRCSVWLFMKSTYF